MKMRQENVTVVGLDVSAIVNILSYYLCYIYMRI